MILLTLKGIQENFFVGKKKQNGGATAHQS